VQNLFGLVLKIVAFTLALEITIMAMALEDEAWSWSWYLWPYFNITAG